jgi:hypothetical protein
MPGLRLRKLPDRTPVRITVSLSPELHHALQDYAALYGEIYGSAEPLAVLVPEMLAGFLDADREFARRRRERATGTPCVAGKPISPA